MVSDSHEYLVRTLTFAEVAASVKEIAPATVTPHNTTLTDAPHAASAQLSVSLALSVKMGSIVVELYD